MSKSDFNIKRISKEEAASILNKYHYLTGISKGFKSGYNYGLFDENELIGVAIFTGFPVPELVKGLFGLERNNQEGFFELSRFCLKPEVQASEHNCATWFLSRCIRLLKKETSVRAILSYADCAYHSGTIYAASNFAYYGKTALKKDFFRINADGSYTKQSRGKTKNVNGIWIDRTQKHRFLLCFDKTLQVKWTPEKWKKETKK